MYVYYVNNAIIILSMFTLFHWPQSFPGWEEHHKVNLEKKSHIILLNVTPSQTVKNFATHVMEKPSFPSFSSRIILEEFTKNKPLYPSIKSRKKRFYRVRILKSSTLSMKSSKKHEISHLLKSLVLVHKDQAFYGLLIRSILWSDVCLCSKKVERLLDHKSRKWPTEKQRDFFSK